DRLCRKQARAVRHRSHQHVARHLPHLERQLHVDDREDALVRSFHPDICDPNGLWVADIFNLDTSNKSDTCWSRSEVQPLGKQPELRPSGPTSNWELQHHLFLVVEKLERSLLPSPLAGKIAKHELHALSGSERELRGETVDLDGWNRKEGLPHRLQKRYRRRTGIFQPYPPLHPSAGQDPPKIDHLRNRAQPVSGPHSSQRHRLLPAGGAYPQTERDLRLPLRFRREDQLHLPETSRLQPQPFLQHREGTLLRKHRLYLEVDVRAVFDRK